MRTRPGNSAEPVSEENWTAWLSQPGHGVVVVVDTLRTTAADFAFRSPCRNDIEPASLGSDLDCNFILKASRTAAVSGLRSLAMTDPLERLNHL